MKLRIGREGMALCVLTVALFFVFALSVQMYDRLETEAADGVLAAAANAARGFLNENDAVAAFFGMAADADEAPDAAATAAAAPTAADAADAAQIRAEAAAYILRYNQIYADLR